MQKRGIFIFSLLILTAVFLSCQKSGTMDVGKSAPPIRLFDLNGKVVSLESLKGKVVIINLWSYT